ncbi:MAG: cobalamin-independent methionine synthase II family protein [Bdellovibrionota bacterium]
MVGSWPRSRALLQAQKSKRLGQLDDRDFQRLADTEIRQLLAAESRIGVDLVTDGELRRDNFYSFVAEKLSGVKLMTLAEMLEHVDDKLSFERLLQTLDVPAYSISNPTCTGRISRSRPLAVDELRFIKQHTDKPVKIPLPGPYLLTRAMFVPEVTRQVYASKEELAQDVVKLLRAEIAELIAEGASFIQLDEPVLTEVAFHPAGTRTFMCASLASRGSSAEELEFAVQLLNEVVAGFSGPILGMHVCRGNWSQNESILLHGSYSPLKPYLERVHVDQLVLEYATERAGEIMPFEGKSLGLGVVNPRSEQLESVEQIVSSVEGALRHFSPQRIHLNPDCGFATFSNSPVNESRVAEAKMQRIVEAAAELRHRFVPGTKVEHSKG